ncbi:actin binding protein [Marasmius crinis-equi]|uniref:Actin binding protein n=1 Tax=Marasmius crinis-equi TaxID=585013 RepID=A0ABR3F4R9_9AGAR
MQGDVQLFISRERVEAASRAKYFFQTEAPRKIKPIAPVGTNYQAIGQVYGSVEEAAFKHDIIGSNVDVNGSSYCETGV